MACDTKITKKRFNMRAWVTWLTAVAFLIMVVSGLVLYVSPRGRVANWSDWTLLSLEKEQWANMHMTAGVLLLLVIVFHVYFNWKPLCSYLKNRPASAGLNIRLHEMLAACVVGAMFIVGTLMMVQPFSLVISTNEQIKNTWENRVETRAGVQHETRVQTSGGGGRFGRMTLDTFCHNNAVSLSEAMAMLREQGIAADAQSSVRDLAGAMDMSPRTFARWLQKG